MWAHFQATVDPTSFVMEAFRQLIFVVFHSQPRGIFSQLLLARDAP